ncbi:MAG: N-acetyltransferase family protein [Granulosicoccus sp.]
MQASEFSIREAVPDDLQDILTGLKALASDLGDPYKAAPDTIREALFGPAAHSNAMLAGKTGHTLGIVLFSPFVSTTLGGTCIYVSDLWVAQSTRGKSLGRQLLAATARSAHARWQATAMILTVYEDNEAAIHFYRQLGFEIHQKDRRAALTGPRLLSLATG